jgi:hypothetical protein
MVYGSISNKHLFNIDLAQCLTSSVQNDSPCTILVITLCGDLNEI